MSVGAFYYVLFDVRLAVSRPMRLNTRMYVVDVFSSYRYAFCVAYTYTDTGIYPTRRALIIPFEHYSLHFEFFFHVLSN